MSGRDGEGLLTAEKLLLLSYDPDGSPGRRTATMLHHALAAGMFDDLLRRGRLGLDGRDKLARLTRVDLTPTGSPVLDDYLQEFARYRGLLPWDILNDFDTPIRRRLLLGLAERGVVDRRAFRSGLRKNTRWVLVDRSVVDDAREAVRAALEDPSVPDPDIRTLIVLIGGLGRLRDVVPGAEDAMARRAEDLAGGHWAAWALDKIRREHRGQILLGRVPTWPFMRGLNRT